MLHLAGRGHRVVYAGCAGVRTAVRQLFRGQASGAVDRFAGISGFDEGGALWYLNLSYSPWSWRLGSARMRAAASSIQRGLPHTRGGKEKGRDRKRIAWIYHPGLLGLARVLQPDMVVYDVMDRFIEFTAAAAHENKFNISQQECETLAEADVVFTGGHSLHNAALKGLEEAKAAKKGAYCFPSGVDTTHFSRALDPALAIPEEMKALPRPVFGYFGAIDERLDTDLITALGRAYPESSVVMAGPVLLQAAIREPNIVFTGPKNYAALPQYLKAFDVCLLPFRMTPLVAHISPTKTPEYLAGGKPVASTEIPDVATDWGDVVRVCRTHTDFITACGELAAHPPDPAALSDAAAARSRSWAKIAEEMEKLILQ